MHLTAGVGQAQPQLLNHRAVAHPSGLTRIYLMAQVRVVRSNLPGNRARATPTAAPLGWSELLLTMCLPAGLAQRTQGPLSASIAVPGPTHKGPVSLAALLPLGEEDTPVPCSPASVSDTPTPYPGPARLPPP